MPVKPVVAYAVGITPAATVSGATPASTNDSTAGTPRRSRASADDTLFRRAACWVRDIVSTPLSGGVIGPGAWGRVGQRRWASSAAPTVAWVQVITSRKSASSRPAACSMRMRDRAGR